MNSSPNINWPKKAMRPDLFVAMAACNNYKTGYIGTAEAYDYGGYETKQDSNVFVSPETEKDILNTIKDILCQ